MAQVGKKPLPHKTRERIERELIRISCFTGKRRGQLLKELLTETEHLMLAKRLAAILMLIDEQSYYRVEQALGMSTSTTKRLHSLLIGGSFKEVEQLARDKRERERLLEDVGVLLRGGLPPYAYVIKKRRPR